MMVSKSLLCFLVVYILSDFSSSEVRTANFPGDGQRNKKFFREDYTYIESVQSFYKIHSVAKTFNDAKQLCAQEGAMLYYAENLEEMEAVASFWNRTQPLMPWVFVGLTDQTAEGIFETVDRRPISEVYTRWQRFQPDDNLDNEDCVHMDLAGTMNDYICDTKAKFICKKTLQSLESDCNSNTPNSVGQRNKKFFRKDYTYIESVQSFYKIHSVAKTFNDAKRLCVQEGAMLYYAENLEEMEAVASFWNRTQPLMPWVFVGLTDQMAEGIFETVDRRPISEVYIRWQRNQPDDFLNNEDCVHMDLAGTMNDLICDSKAMFICKKTLQSLEWDFNCNMPNLGYTYNQDIGKCYKMHTTPMNWADAYAMCQIESTSLAVINSLMEADYLAQLTKTTPKPLVAERYQEGIYHVGFHNRFQEGWQTVEGTPMNVDAGIWFNNRLPQNRFEECGSMFFNGRLVSTDCSMKSLFICEQIGTPTTTTSTTEQNEENYMKL